MKFISFDFFDTLFFRKINTNHELFKLVASELISNDILSDFNIAELVDLRIYSEETILKKKHLNFDAKLSEIRDELTLYVGQTRANLWFDKEIDLERENLLPIKWARNKFNSFVENGTKIGVLSDTHYSSDFIRDILIEHNFNVENVLIFTSSEYNSSKFEGGLYELVKDLHNLDYSNWVHYGDNLFSDIKIPKSKGINTKYLNNSALNNWENYVRQNNVSLAYKLRSLRLSSLKSSNQTDWINGFLSPIIFCWLQFIYVKLFQNEFDLVLFSSRDTKLLHSMYLENFYGKNINSDYLVISRESINLASVYNLEEDLFWMISDWESLNFNDVLSKLDLKLEDLPKDIINRFQKFKLKNKKYILAMIDTLLSIQFVRTLILSNAENRRKNLLLYLSKFNIPLRDNSTLFIDIGWAKTTQHLLNKIFLKEYGCTPFSGLYFGVKGQEYLKSIHKDSFAVYSQGNKSDVIYGRASFVFEDPTFFEHLLGINFHTKVTRYMKNGDYADPDIITDQSKLVFYNEVLIKLSDTINLINELKISFSTDEINDLMRLFYQKPVGIVITDLQKIKVTTDFYDRYSKPLIGKLTILNLFSKQRYYWHEGALYYSGKFEFYSYALKFGYFFKKMVSRIIS